MGISIRIGPYGAHLVRVPFLPSHRGLQNHSLQKKKKKKLSESGACSQRENCKTEVKNSTKNQSKNKKKKEGKKEGGKCEVKNSTKIKEQEEEKKKKEKRRRNVKPNLVGALAVSERDDGDVSVAHGALYAASGYGVHVIRAPGLDVWREVQEV
eukprot:575598-Rhodomonas_salina.4